MPDKNPGNKNADSRPFSHLDMRNIVFSTEMTGMVPANPQMADAITAYMGVIEPVDGDDEKD